ncbi:MAG: endonuclease/exonuclease/phosphatase family protein [Bacteroidales bacterium]|jgi:exonuclease III|nr:endonuclease/exonuclease/phosphatase family protein [Bacteroidales bacterium]
MKKTALLLLTAIVFASCDKREELQQTQLPLCEQMFAKPDSTYYSGVWWWWLRVKTSKEAITRDLEAMKANHIQRVIHADFGCGGGQPRIDHLFPYLDVASPEWNELVKHCISECRRLGLDFGLCAEGSGAKAPWNKPEDMQQQLTYTEYKTEGATALDIKLPLPDKLRLESNGEPVWYRDIAILAMPDKETVAKDEIIDITEHLQTDGQLKWSVPAGKWKILRIGYTPTFARMNEFLYLNHLKPEAYRSYYDHYYGNLLKELPPEVRSAAKVIESDSYEAGHCDWSSTFEASFQRLRGYSPRPYLPVLRGQTVESKEVSSRFMYDYRKTISDLIVGHYRLLQEYAYEDGQKTLLEASGPHQHWADALECQKYADYPMGEFWAPAKTHRTTLPTRFMSKEAVSAAHIYGKRVIAAESFTSVGPSWEEAPWTLKSSADRAFCEGINQIYFHTFSHSPSLTAKPGYVYSFAGSHFNQNITWWNYAYDWLMYLSRCQYMLQQGVPVADVSYYYGNGLNRKFYRQETPALGSAYLYDYTNSDAILERMSVKDGKIVMPDGMTYSMLVMPENQAATFDGFGRKTGNALPAQRDFPVEVIKKIRDLAKAGATIVGLKPLKSVGLKDYEKNDRTVTRIADEMWGEGDANGVVDRRYGKGRVICGMTVREALAAMGVLPDFEYKSVCRDSSEIDFTHRRVGADEVYFLANLIEQTDTLTATFRVTGKAPQLWDAADGNIYDLADYTDDGARTSLPLVFAPYGSMFIVFRDTTKADCFVQRNDGAPDTINKVLNLVKVSATQDTLLVISAPWQVTFDPQWGGPAEPITFKDLQLWNESKDDRIKYYSGTAIYRTTINLTAPVDANAVKQSHSTASVIANAVKQSQNQETDCFVPRNDAAPRLFLSLGDELYNIAEIHINGKNLGTVWKKPYIKDITEAVREGENEIEIRVTNLWPNRLIGDSGLPQEKRYTETNVTKFKPETPLFPSGLLGPVIIQSHNCIPAVAKPTASSLKVLQLNTWINGNRVEGGKEGLLATIEELQPDVVLLCELASDETTLSRYLQKELEAKGQKWFIDGQQKGCGILSKYELFDIKADTTIKGRPFVKAHIDVNGSKIAIYSAHLDHRYYAPYLSRGYSGEKWGEKITPVTDEQLILAENRKSTRNAGIDAFIADAEKERQCGNAVILGGDFNEPSHLDWQANTKNTFGRNGVAVNWEVSIKLQKAGYIDAYRQKYPNPLTHPAITWPAGNASAKLQSLFFCPEADERDRIDFIYYSDNKTITLENTGVVGPAASVEKGKIVSDKSFKDAIITPQAVWLSDHKGNLAVFKIINNQRL